MSVDVMESPVQGKRQRRNELEISVAEIIAAGRNAPAGSWGVWATGVVAGLIWWCSFTPLDWGWLGWLGVVPWVMLIRLARPTRWMYVAIYVTSAVAMLVQLQWMRLGHATMYTAWAALSLYAAMYVPAFVGISRVAVHRLRAPMLLAVPITWVGLEYVRAYALTGFSWYYLGHTQHRWTTLIQISDLVGAYGVSFVVAMGGTVLGMMIPASWAKRLGLFPSTDSGVEGAYPAGGREQLRYGFVMLTVLGAAVGYGMVRRGQAEFVSGPRVGIVQGNFDPEVKHSREVDERQMIYRAHSLMTGVAVSHQAEVILWPETMYPFPLLKLTEEMSDEELGKKFPEVPVAAWREGKVGQNLRDMADQSQASLMLGVAVIEGSQSGMRHYNSAVLSQPGKGISGRYDKIHRVPFGEYIPLRSWLPWLQDLTPYGDQFGITEGDGVHVFRHGDYTFVPVICFEDTVPHLVSGMLKSARQVAGGDVDCLVNLTNDGWFRGSSELDQHLITAKFRCVEARTPMVRAVNTGISAIIDGDGVVRKPEVFVNFDSAQLGEAQKELAWDSHGKSFKRLNGVLVSNVPLDGRSSVYVSVGDWFAMICGACMGAIVLLGYVVKRGAKKDEAPGEPGRAG